MKKVAKLVIIDPNNMYLLMWRGNHPIFGNDPDLPGGTMEGNETLEDTMIREVYEEAGIAINASTVHKVYSGTDYSTHGTHYALYVAKLDNRPEIKMSWEHSSYTWLTRDEFLEKSKHANDSFMRMVFAEMKAFQ